MTQTDFLRFVAIRLGGLVAVLYLVRVLTPDQALAPSARAASSAGVVLTNDLCQPAKPIEKSDVKNGAMLQDMLLHD